MYTPRPLWLLGPTANLSPSLIYPLVQWYKGLTDVFVQIDKPNYQGEAGKGRSLFSAQQMAILQGFLPLGVS